MGLLYDDSWTTIALNLFFLKSLDVGALINNLIGANIRRFHYLTFVFLLFDLKTVEL